MTSDLCEQFCTNPIGPDGEPGTEDFRACCPACRRLVDLLADEVLPAIRRHGYWSPPTADVDDELRALIDQAGFRAELRDLLAPFKAARIDGDGPT
jgi:hypothetical protein